MFSSAERSRFLSRLVNQKGLTIIVVVLIVAVLAAGLARLITVDVGIRNHFNPDDPHLVKLEAFEETYAASDSVLIVVEASNDTIFTRAAILAIDELT